MSRSCMLSLLVALVSTVASSDSSSQLRGAENHSRTPVSSETWIQETHGVHEETAEEINGRRSNEEDEEELVQMSAAGGAGPSAAKCAQTCGHCRPCIKCIGKEHQASCKARCGHCRRCAPCAKFAR
eukprot:TRINITY_DN43237_c0_g1_i1.p1 TRINITY_DN43237_c0_g1~~TRINITY_DN43237_c0_g1_i1.p1  ORF type:complete len:127 (-),score=20.70 TRINITY_DN43237_c0_g1_i1:214-594(-)